MDKDRQLVVVGAGGHAKVVIEALRAGGFSNIVGVVSNSPGPSAVMGVPVIGNDESLVSLRNSGVRHAVVAIGDNATRDRLGDQLASSGFALVTTIHPSALISPSAMIFDGAVIMAGAVVGTEVKIERLAILNTAAHIDHEGSIGSAAHVGPGCALSGNVTVGRRALIGVGASVRPNISIGEAAVVGAGSVVVDDVLPGSVVVGSPARLMRKK
jgi:UDP-perosamine 4-acetyltransferase